jgi:predicted RNase H-like HicB family nuclease
MRHSIKAFVHQGEDYYVAECMEIAVVTQGKTLDETIANLKEAVALHLEDEDLTDFDLAPHPSLLITWMNLDEQKQLSFNCFHDMI